MTEVAPAIQVTGTIAFDTVVTVARLPVRNETARVERLSLLPGGAAGNVAFGLARLGARPRLVAAVGPDFAGSEYEARLRAVGVDLSGLLRLGLPTAHAVLASDPAGDQHVYFYPGASHLLADAPAPAAGIGHFTAGPIDRYASRMRACRTVAFDPGQECFHRDVAEITRLFPLVDVLFLNEHELARLRDAEGWTVRRLLDAGPDAVLVTLGAAGQEVHTRDGTERVPAVPVRVVEPTGAGDAHRTGFLHALAAGADVAAAARLGAVVASFAVSSLGTQAGLPTLAEARERYEKAFGPWPLRDAPAATDG